MDKRGISTLIATVLLVLITLAAVGIVWVAVLPLIQGNIENAQKCNNANINIDSFSGYTCFDQNKLYVMLNRGPSESEIAGIQMRISGKEGSKTIDITSEVPDLKRSDIKILLVSYEGYGNGTNPSNLSWVKEFTRLGYNVTVPREIYGWGSPENRGNMNPPLNINEIRNYPKSTILLCTGILWSCRNFADLNIAYNEGYSIFTEGNDNAYISASPILLPPAISNGNTPVVPANTGHPLTKGWTSISPDMESHSAINMTNPNSTVIGYDSGNANIKEIVYLEEFGKGRWFYYIPSTVPPDALLINAINYLARPQRVYDINGKDATSLPLPNENKNYLIDLSYLGISNVETVSIAPIVKTGTKSRVCEMSAPATIRKCSIS